MKCLTLYVLKIVLQIQFSNSLIPLETRKKKKGLRLTGHVIFVKVYNLLHPQELLILHSQITAILEVAFSQL